MGISNARPVRVKKAKRTHPAKFLFNFKKQFAPAVEAGTKTRTVRSNRKDGRRPNPGDTACCYTGLRTRNSRLLREARVIECLSIRMYYADQQLLVDGLPLDKSATATFALLDGHADAAAMFAWFQDQYGGAEFEGFCAMWKA